VETTQSFSEVSFFFAPKRASMPINIMPNNVLESFSQLGMILRLGEFGLCLSLILPFNHG
jgi:hypothetical protein